MGDGLGLKVQSEPDFQRGWMQDPSLPVCGGRFPDLSFPPS